MKEDLNSLLPPSQYDNTMSLKRNINKTKNLELKELNFCNATINKATVRKFIMRNNSGIKAMFNIYSKNYEPMQYLNNEITAQHVSSKQSIASEISNLSLNL